MKLEYLPDGSPDCPLLRLFAFTKAEAKQLRAAVSALAAGRPAVAVHRLPFVEAVGGCQLTLQVTGWDQAITRGAGCNEFTCGFTAGTWANVAGLLEPFAESTAGSQWLAGPPGEAALVLSASGQW